MKVLQFDIGENGAKLTCYLQDSSPAIYGSERRPAVVIFPGGGYEFVSDPEGEPVALAYAAEGFHAFVLTYSVGEKGVFPIPQREAFAAIALIRRHAREWGVDEGKIAVAGFSAGGHLAASCGVYWKDERVNPEADKRACRPDALVLGYPCITAGEYAYPGINTVHGKGTAFPELLSLETHVDGNTPPAFVCHTSDDTCVPAINSLLFCTALARANVAYELHIYKEGPHGMSLANGAVSSPLLAAQDEDVRHAVGAIARRFSGWLKESVAFLKQVFEPVRFGYRDGKLFLLPSCGKEGAGCSDDKKNVNK